MIDILLNLKLFKMKDSNYKHSEITEKILKAYFTVYNKLGY